MKHELFRLETLPTGRMISAVAGKVRLVIVRTPNGDLHALRDACPHRAAALSLGMFYRAMTASEPGSYELSHSMVLKCPWHGYEYDVETGECLGDSNHARVRTFPVWVEEGVVCVETR